MMLFKVIKQKLLASWYSVNPPPVLLILLSYLYKAIIYSRYRLYQRGYLKPKHLSKPVIIVGNITLGGTGKTPLIIALAKLLQQQGIKVGIVSRGYKSKGQNYPQLIAAKSDVMAAGDEAVMLARRTDCPVIIDPNRVRAAEYLIQHFNPDIILSDDGLQHYRLHRDIEIAVIDGARQFGNGYCLPAGPLREPISRLARVDYLLVQAEKKFDRASYQIQLKPVQAINIQTGRSLAPDKLLELGHKVHAVAGIGHPQRFFALLASLGFSVMPHAYEDHYAFQPKDLIFSEALPVIMTEKDAVKCEAFAQANWWYLRVEAILEAAFCQRLLERVNNM